MKESTLSDLICPAFIAGTRCNGQLALDDDPVPVVRAEGDPTEVLEGIVRCQSCGEAYPIICGVLILVKGIKTYLAQHYSEIMSVAVDCGIGRSMVGYLKKVG